MNWYRQWKQRRFERQIYKALLQLGLAKALDEAIDKCQDCDGKCEVCEIDCMDCD